MHFKKRIHFFLTLIFIHLIFEFSVAQDKSSITFSGELSCWIDLAKDNYNHNQFGLRYIPELFSQNKLSEQINWDLLTSLNTLANGSINKYENLQNTALNKEIQLYRAWMRFSSNQLELRIGLQKINFGSASILRPLMWFDSVDPRDPTGITNGVKAILFRYYFLNNINVWLWGLYGNDDLRGWELLTTKKDIPEFGGRIQTPIFTGEAAFSYHMRSIDLQNTLFSMLPVAEKKFKEYRFAIDGKWDYIFGSWFETSLIYQDYELLPLRYQHILNIGADYTFNFGNGLNIVLEHFISEYSEDAFKPGQGFRVSALSMNYTLSLLDRITTITYYTWDDQQIYYFLSCQRRYDKFSINILGYWNPDGGQIYMNQNTENTFLGKGVNIFITFNH